ncbi:hypothetical protein [Bosea massiliensis]|uniref:Uncharacterized protein n=1 Tax=Bosea massiliensis TaxID=151419 RepID=A0ABW0P3A7_9HYPH
MTLVLRALERDVKATLAEFVLCHDRDEAEALMVAFEGAGVDFVDLISDPHFYLQIGKRPDAKGMVRVGRGRVQQKTASAVIDAIIASARHSRDNNVTLALVDLETIN